jgi:hypothetical protein
LSLSNCCECCFNVDVAIGEEGDCSDEEIVDDGLVIDCCIGDGKVPLDEDVAIE